MDFGVPQVGRTSRISDFSRLVCPLFTAKRSHRVLENVFVAKHVVRHGDFSAGFVLTRHLLEAFQRLLRKRRPRHSPRKGGKSVTVRQPHHHPLHRINASEQPYLEERGTHVKNAAELVQCPVAATRLKSKQRNSVAPQAEHDSVVDSFCNRINQVDRKQRLCSLNDAVGTNAKRLVGRDCPELLPEDDLSGVNHKVGQAVRRGSHCDSSFFLCHNQLQNEFDEETNVG